MKPTGPDKPPFGLPCNGCGYCCAAELCQIGIAIHGDIPAPCPSMEWEDSRFRCGAIRLADSDIKYGLLVRMALGIGLGCDSETDAEFAAREASS